MATATDGAFCPQCGTSYDRSVLATKGDPAESRWTKPIGGWGLAWIVVIVVALLLWYVYVRVQAQHETRQISDRFSGYTDETIECLSAGGSEYRCVLEHER